mgnify:CR=1 FL=1
MVKYILHKISSEEHELFSDVTNDLVRNDLKYVERYGFAERSAFADNDDVSFLNGESGGDMGMDVSMSLFVSVIFGDVVKIISSDDNGSLHFG